MKAVRIGIIGSGNMGRILGLRWAELGHEVFFGSRSEESLEQVKHNAPVPVHTGSLMEAARFGDVLLNTVRGVPLSEIVRREHLAGKVVIDINNFSIPPGFQYPAVTESLAERTQRDAPDSKVVKAFNNLAQEVFEHSPATLRSQQTATYLASDDVDAKQQVAALASSLGLNPVDAGPLRQARLLESMGDFIRLLMGGPAQLGGMAHLSVQVLPPPETIRLGGRQASQLS